MKRDRVALVGLALAAVVIGGPLFAADPVTIVACAPGYPGTTEQAQPALDAFASALEGAAGWKAGALHAVYHPTADGGIAAIRAKDAAAVMVPLAFFLRYGEELNLRPVALAATEAGSKEVWSVVARKGVVTSPASLDGWTVVGLPGYAPGFVRDAVLGAWGELPAGTTIEAGRVLSALRRAAAGEKVAVLLNPAQAAALDRLPFGKDLEIVARSRPLPTNLFCFVGSRLGKDARRALLDGLLKLHQDPTGKEALAGIRLARFVPADSEEIARLREQAAPEASR